MTEVTEATRRRSGPGSVETARRLIDLANILADLSRFDEAERSTREALAILEASPQAPLSEKAKARRILANLLQVAWAAPGRPRSSSPPPSTCCAPPLGPEHFQVAYTLVQYGFVLSELRRYPEAEQTLREAIRLLEPLDHYDVDTARRYLGFCLMSQVRFAEAEQQFIAAEQSLRRKLGEDHPLVWAARFSQGWARLGSAGSTRRSARSPRWWPSTSAPSPRATRCVPRSSTWARWPGSRGASTRRWRCTGAPGRSS